MNKVEHFPCLTGGCPNERLRPSDYCWLHGGLDGGLYSPAPRASEVCAEHRLPMLDRDEVVQDLITAASNAHIAALKLLRDAITAAPAEADLTNIVRHMADLKNAVQGGSLALDALLAEQAKEHR